MRRSKRRRNPILRPGILTAAVVVGSLVLIGIAQILYRSTDAFWVRIADLTLQAALITAVGGLVTAYIKLSFDDAADRRERLRENASDRRQFLRRTAEVHSAVEYASTLIRAHGSRGVYVDQMRTLMLARTQLWEIYSDLRSAKGLFEPDDETIQENLLVIIDFLNEGVEEYTTFCSGRPVRRLLHIRPSPGADEQLELAAFNGRGPLRWLANLTHPVELDETGHKRKLPRKYEEALDQSKGKMREHVHRQV